MPGQQHQRITALGVLGPLATPFEQWSMSVAISDSTVANFDQAAAGYADAWGDYVTRASTHLAPFVRLTQVAVAIIGADGKQIGETIRVPRSQNGGGGNVTVPPQVALRVSLGSGLRGRSQRGGFYLPCPDLQISTATGQFAEADATAILQSTNVLLESLEAVSDGQVVVASGVDGNVPANVIRVGRRLDTIRRRANAIPEGYVALTRG